MGQRGQRAGAACSDPRPNSPGGILVYWSELEERCGQKAQIGESGEVRATETHLSLLDGDQFGELGRDVCHRRFCSTQTASRAKQGANLAESFIRRAVHDGHEQVTR